jgi:hypothetical protein
LPAEPSTGPELALLCRCLASEPDTASVSRIERSLSAPLDWEGLIRMAHPHRVAPLLYWNLSRISPQRVPGSILERLRCHFESVQHRNRQLTDELIRLVRLLTKHNIQVVPYKGPVLALSAYRNLALREFTDLDVLIHKRDLPRTKNLLISEGFSPRTHATYWDEADELELGYNLLFVHAQTAIEVEVHWAFTSKYLPFAADLPYLDKRLDSLLVEGSRLSTIMPEDLLLILCVHASKHLWDTLIMFSDVAELIRRNISLDWSRIVEQAAALGATRMLMLGLLLVNGLLEVSIPAPLLAMAGADQLVSLLAGQVMETHCNEDCSPLSTLQFYEKLAR